MDNEQYAHGHRNGFVHGARVRLRAEAFGYARPHLLWHARQGDVGIIAGPSRQSPAMSQLYTIVHFDQCGHDHRLLTEELEHEGAPSA
jgi:hypothetical protein